MVRPEGAMHVARIKSRHTTKAGQEKVYESVLLRRTYRDGGKVKHDTLANLAPLPSHVVDLIEASLKGQSFVPAEAAASVESSLPHGHVAAVWAMAKKLGLPGLLGPAGRARDLALGLIIARVCKPGSKLATTSWWSDTTLGVDLGIADAGTDEVYAAMDALIDRQDAIEKALAERHLAPEHNPQRMALFDLSSSWVEGKCCPLAARGYSRDGKKNKLQIEYGLLTDPAGRPVAIRTFAGNTADPTAFIEAVKTVRTTFGLTNMVMVGDRGMITTARIDALKEDADEDEKDRLGWLTCLRAPAIKKLAEDDGPLQMSLFDTQDLAEISHPDYPGERLIACKNPALAQERGRKRDELLTATETLLAPVIQAVQAQRLHGADKIGLKVGKLLNKYKMGKHFQLTITDTSLRIERDTAGITSEQGLDGIYVLRTPIPAEQLDAPGVVTAYKNLAHVETDFRHIKIDDLALRPIHHHLTERVQAHILICMLAAYLIWHLRTTLAPLTFTDEHPPARANPVTPAHRSKSATIKAAKKTNSNGEPVRSFRTLINHLATLTRNNLRYNTPGCPLVPTLTEPTPTQHRAFELIGHPIPLTLK